jgi:hypothetical protein
MIPRYMIALVIVASFGFSISSASSDEYPILNVAPLCHGIVGQSSLQEGLGTVSFDECMKAEQGDRQTIIKEWSTFSADDKRHCVAEATMGGDSSYTELLTCLEMARDVRQLKAEEQKHTENDKAKSLYMQQGLPAPVGHRQPTQ